MTTPHVLKQHWRVWLGVALFSALMGGVISVGINTLFKAEDSTQYIPKSDSTTDLAANNSQANRAAAPSNRSSDLADPSAKTTPAETAKGSADNRRNRPPERVTIAQVKTQTLLVTQSLQGVVLNAQRLEVRAAQSNRIQTIHVKNGQYVKRGQLLISLDDRAELVNLDRAKALLQKDEVTVNDVLRQKMRTQELVQQGFAPQTQLDQLETQLQSAEANRTISQANVKVAQLALDNTRITAPFAGQLGALQITPGSFVQPSGPTLVTLARTDPIEIQFSLPARLITTNNVRQLIGTPINIIMPSSSSAAAESERRIQGIISFIDTQIEVQSGQLVARAQLNDRSLLAGQTVTLEWVSQRLKDVKTVPTSAVHIDETGRSSLWRLDTDLKVQRVPIEQLQVVGQWSTFTAPDIAISTRIVLQGRENLRPGQTVVIASDNETKARQKNGRQAKSSATTNPTAKTPTPKAPAERPISR